MRYRKPLYLYLAATIVAVIVSDLGGAAMPPLPGAAVHANGFTVPLAEGDSGPYSYLVGIWPAQPVVGNLHMAVALTSEQGPVTDATVEIRGRIGQRGPLSEPVPASSYFLQSWSYELDMSLREPGQWIFEIKINSSLGETVLDVPVEVVAGLSQETSGGPTANNDVPGSGGPNWVLISGILAALTLGAGSWVFVQRQRAESRAVGADQSRWERRRRRK